MQQRNDRIHAVAREEIRSCKDNHDQADREDHGGDGSD